jgi:hypothetical protein
VIWLLCNRPGQPIPGIRLGFARGFTFQRHPEFNQRELSTFGSPEKKRRDLQVRDTVLKLEEVLYRPADQRGNTQGQSECLGCKFLSYRPFRDRPPRTPPGDFRFFTFSGVLCLYMYFHSFRCIHMPLRVRYRYRTGTGTNKRGTFGDPIWSPGWPNWVTRWPNWVTRWPNWVTRWPNWVTKASDGGTPNICHFPLVPTSTKSRWRWQR